LFWPVITLLLGMTLLLLFFGVIVGIVPVPKNEQV